MKIRLIGQRNQTGIGTHYANFADAVLATEWANCVEELDHTDREGLVAGYERSEPDDINIVFVCMPLQRAYRGTTIQWVVFESTRMFPTILDTLLDAHQIWVPSAWGRDILIQHGLNPAQCWVVHEGVDPQRYTTIATHKSDTLNYLFNGKCEIRKSIVETVQAWQQEFGNDPGVKLILKTGHYTDQEYQARKLQELTNCVNGSTNIEIIWGEIPDADLTALYQQSDIFVLPSKAEGWGLPLIEAAAQGMPIISTIYSGHAEFLQPIESSVVSVEYDMCPIQCPEIQFFYPMPDGDWGKWAQPQVDSIRRELRHARENYTQLKITAMSNSKIISRDFSWTASADRALALLQAQGLLVKK
jgi:glycosyltransferase involved in cell wall biosynthesis